MAAERLLIGFNGPTSLRTDESLVSADAACRLTTLSLALLRFCSSGRIPHNELGQNRCQIERGTSSQTAL
jgi:hypothetical protein